MTLSITLAGMSAFLFISVLLLVFSVFDLRSRRVPNEFVAIGVVLGVIIGTVTGHLYEQLLMHIISIVLALFLGYSLFRIGAIGGADAKSLLLIALVSPGIEFTAYENWIYEATVGGLVPPLFMLLCGYLCSRRGFMIERRRTPLIPFLLVGYLFLQVIAIF